MSRSVSDAVLGALADARALGFLGPGPLEQHITSAQRFADALDAGSAQGPALDLGSGGGVPGMILAVWFSEWPWVLLDAQRRRTSFLAATVARCQFADRVTVLRGRAEDVGHAPAHREQYGTVTARSFGPPASTAEAAAAFLQVGGVVVIAEPPDGGQRWHEAGLARVALRCSAGSHPGVVVLEKYAELAVEFPRELAVQRRSPLF